MEEYRDSIAIIDNTCGNVVMWVLRVTNDLILWDKKFDFEYKLEDQEYYRALGFMNKDKLVLTNIFKSHYKDYEYFLYDVENGFQQPFTTPKRLDDARKKCNFFLWADPPYTDRAREVIEALKAKLKSKDEELQRATIELRFVEKKC
ncbi:hypothetical protein POM88_001607 [Heracleum sosnowskyi]|uniref:Uncharacterized protein n=1 Tax=Heracleum sosnowskyi TaxID=360622 RepID=A0AAD8NAJ7_9APIA|nr:hypothetical protein POM88_001607 [Heracleum sosnowskyi]